MPGPGSWVPTIGVPFQAMKLSNGEDRSSVVVTFTVTDAAGRFALDINNGGGRATRAVYFDPAPVELPLPVGVTSRPTPGTRRYSSLSMSFSSA